ncbi:MAG TPA: nucleoside deaminase [Xanthobacteraceae bacterium]|jgi:tRNA(adenine34) deaminase
MMARCIELSKLGAAAGELPFGSLIARDGQIIAEATNEIERFTDESRHAEIIAIARARRLLSDEELRSCTLYSTVEPCAMCSFCIRCAGIGRVVFGLGSPRLGGLSRWNILGDARHPLLFGSVPELTPGIQAEKAYGVWKGLKPAIARATLWFGYLREPKPAGAEARTSERCSVGRLFSVLSRCGQRLVSATPLPIVLRAYLDVSGLVAAYLLIRHFAGPKPPANAPKRAPRNVPPAAV